MYFSNLALGVVCIMLLAAPLFFLALWLLLGGAAFIVERSAGRGVLEAEAEAEVNSL